MSEKCANGVFFIDAGLRRFRDKNGNKKINAGA